jgi:hypothetical protein
MIKLFSRFIVKRHGEEAEQNSHTMTLWQLHDKPNAHIYIVMCICYCPMKSKLFKSQQIHFHAYEHYKASQRTLFFNL